MTSPSRRPSAGSCDDRLVIVGVEVGAERLDRAHAALAQDLAELPVDQLDAAAVRLAAVAARVGLQRALEIVDRAAAVLRSCSAAAASDSV